MSAGNNCLTIGLDYGTTYTGVAYQVTTYDKGKANINDSIVITNWKRLLEQKVPSEISYSTTSEGNYQWGADISVGGQKMIWTKLELDQQGRKQELELILGGLIGMRNLDLDEIRRENGLPSYPAKEPVDIVADYLSKIRAKLVEELTKDFGVAVFSAFVTDVVVTVPAVWSDEAKNLTFRAVNNAGFTNKYFKGLRDFIFVTEPEAAALYSIKSLMEDEDEDFLEPRDCFVQVDLGGGTVDLISFCVETVSPDLNLQQIGSATGDRCGATFLDRNFKKLLEEKLGPESYNKLAPNNPEHAIGSHTIVDRDLQMVMKHFERIKRTFDGSIEDEVRNIVLPGALSELDDPEKGIEDGEIVFKDEEMRQLFHPIMIKIGELISGQIGQTERAGYQVRYIILSGGFANSEYLRRQLKGFGLARGIQVKWPKYPQVAVIKGAVAKRLEQNSQDRVRMLKCSASYGISISQPYSAYLHSEEATYRDPFDDELKAREQIVWLIKKGDLILSNTPKHASVEFCRRFGLTDPKIFITNLIIYSGRDAPQSLAKVPAALRTVHPITYDISDIPQDRFVAEAAGPNGNPYFSAFFRADALLHKSLRFSISLGDKELAATDLSYVQA